jgi:hypothetical protein
MGFNVLGWEAAWREGADSAGGVVLDCLGSAAVTWSVVFGERSGRVHQRVVTRSTGVDGQ